MTPPQAVRPAARATVPSAALDTHRRRARRTGTGRDADSAAALDRIAIPAGGYARATEAVDGPHGDGHATRVLVWANVIANRMLATGIMVDLDAVRWAAVLHDTQRLDDGHDPDHGLRISELIDAGRLAVLDRLTPQTRRRISEACRWHTNPEPMLSASPELALPELVSPELVCLVDADRLDLVRYGRLDRSRLLTRTARDLTHHSHRLWLASAVAERGNARWQVREQARGQGWWSDRCGRDWAGPAPRCSSC